MDKQNLLNAANLITEFLDSRPGGESYWIDEEGRNHDADIGYVSEFLDDLKMYLEGRWVSKNLRYAYNPAFRYIVTWQQNDGQYQEMMCEDIRFKNDRLEMVNGISVKYILFKAVSGIEVTEIGSGRHVFGYGSFTENATS